MLCNNCFNEKNENQDCGHCGYPNQGERKYRISLLIWG